MAVVRAEILRAPVCINSARDEHDASSRNKLPNTVLPPPPPHLSFFCLSFFSFLSFCLHSISLVDARLSSALLVCPASSVPLIAKLSNRKVERTSRVHRATTTALIAAHRGSPSSRRLAISHHRDVETERNFDTSSISGVGDNKGRGVSALPPIGCAHLPHCRLSTMRLFSWGCATAGCKAR